MEPVSASTVGDDYDVQGFSRNKRGKRERCEKTEAAEMSECEMSQALKDNGRFLALLVSSELWLGPTPLLYHQVWLHPPSCPEGSQKGPSMDDPRRGSLCAFPKQASL